MPALLEREVNGWFYNAYASRYETRDQLVRKLLRDEEDFVRILRYCYAMPRRTVTALFPEISSTRLDHLVGSGLLMEKVFSLPGGQQSVFMLTPDMMRAYGGGAAYRYYKTLFADDETVMSVACCAPFAACMRPYFDSSAIEHGGMCLTRRGTGLFMTAVPGNVTEALRIITGAKGAYGGDSRILLVFDHMMSMRSVMAKIFSETGISDIGRLLFSFYAAGVDDAKRHIYMLRQVPDGIEMQRFRLSSIIKGAVT